MKKLTALLLSVVLVPRSARFSIFPISCVITFLPNTRTALTLGVNFCAGAMC